MSTPYVISYPKSEPRQSSTTLRVTSLTQIDHINLVSGASIIQWAKRWPSDLTVASSSPARGEIFSAVNGVPLHTSFHCHPPIVLMWLKYCCKGRKIADHPPIHQPSFKNQFVMCLNLMIYYRRAWHADRGHLVRQLVSVSSVAIIVVHVRWMCKKSQTLSWMHDLHVTWNDT